MHGEAGLRVSRGHLRVEAALNFLIALQRATMMLECVVDIGKGRTCMVACWAIEGSFPGQGRRAFVQQFRK